MKSSLVVAAVTFLVGIREVTRSIPVPVTDDSLVHYVQAGKERRQWWVHPGVRTHGQSHPKCETGHQWSHKIVSRQKLKSKWFVLILQNSCQFMRHAKRKKLTHEDFNKALKTADVQVRIQRFIRLCSRQMIVLFQNTGSLFTFDGWHRQIHFERSLTDLN